MIEAANHVATTARNLLTSMLAAGLTIAATMLACSDEALLRDSIEVMDTLGIRTRLSLIFLLVPVFFVFVHLNALMKLFLLYRRLGAFEGEMARRNFTDGEKIRWRRLVHGFGFAQIHLPPENSCEMRDILHRCLQRFLMWIAIVLAPLTILITCQISFVRFQSAGITLAHQVLFIVDLAGLIWFSLGISTSPTTRSLPGVARFFLSCFCVILLVWLSLGQAVPPSPTETLEAVRGTRFASSTLHPLRAYLDVLDKASSGHVNLLDGVSGLSKWSWTRRYLDVSRLTLINPDGTPDLLNAFFPVDDDRKNLDRQLNTDGKPDQLSARIPVDRAKKNQARQPNSDGKDDQLNAIVPADVIRKSLAKQQSVAMDFKGRTFHFANFSGAQIFAANFSSIDARKSVWTSARLDNAIFNDAKLHEASFDHAEMIGVSLNRATLYRARFVEAQMTGTQMEEARVHGAVLDRAKLTRSSLKNADLRGASMSEADLSDADISGVKIRVTKLDRIITNRIKGRVESCDGAYIVTNNENEMSNIVDVQDTKCVSVGREEFIVDHYENYKDEQESFLCRIMIDELRGGDFSEIHRKLFDFKKCDLH